MGGSSTKKPLGSTGDKLKNTVVADVINNGVRTVSGGSYSFDKRGWAQNGGPFKGDSYVRGVSGSYTAGKTDDMYDAKDAAVAASAEAKRLAKTEQEKLLGAAKEREANEKGLAQATDDVARAKALQDRRSRGKGRSSTIVNDGTSQVTGNSGSGKSLLGV